MLVIDNHGEGGRGPIKIQTAKQSVDVSNGWKSQLIFDLNIVPFIKDHSEFSDPHEISECNFIDYDEKAIHKGKLNKIIEIKIDQVLKASNYILGLIIVIAI